jgi:glycosyltransferase involved in cell wall biosynthesis
MRVLLISRAMVASSYRRRLSEMTELGIRLTVVSADKWERQRFEPGEADGYEMIVVPTAVSWSLLGSLAHHTFYYKGLSRVISRERWDLVHIDDEPYNFATFRASAACVASNTKFVFTTWQNMIKSYPPPFNYFERKTFTAAAGATPGNREALDVLRSRGFSGPAAVVPHHGVDTNCFRKLDATALRRELHLGSRFVIGFVGRMVYQKGVDILVRALARLTPECLLLLIGQGPAVGELQAILRDLGLSDRVRWLPWLATTELPLYMNALDVLVLPSRTVRTAKEQFGRVLAEAMACETCVVGSDSGEIPRVIGDAGLIFREGDEISLAACLHRLSADVRLRQALGQRGRERVVENFSDRRVAEGLASFYRRVCGRDEPKTSGIAPAVVSHS